MILDEVRDGICPWILERAEIEAKSTQKTSVSWSTWQNIQTSTSSDLMFWGLICADRDC